MLRNGDIINIIHGLDGGKKGTVVEYLEDSVTCSLLEGNFDELYGLAGNYTFDIDNVVLSVPTFEVGDVVTVRAESREGKKNINKKATTGLQCKLLAIGKHKGTIELSDGECCQVGLTLLDRVEFERKVIKKIKFSDGDVVVYKENGVSGVGLVREKGNRETVLQRVEGDNTFVRTKNIFHKITLTDMLKKAVRKEATVDNDIHDDMVIAVNPFQTQPTARNGRPKLIEKPTGSKDEIKKRLEILYRDEVDISKLKTAELRNASEERIAKLIRGTLKEFNRNKKAALVFPNGKIVTENGAPKTRVLKIKQAFFGYLAWKSQNNPNKLVKEVAGLYSFMFKKTGKVNAEKGQYIKLKEYLDGDAIDVVKKPDKLKDNYLGIEIECYITTNMKDIRQKLIAQGVSRYVDITSDGSLRPPDDTIGIEVRVLVKESLKDKVLAKIFTAINSAGGSVNHACGLHVHLDMRNRDVNKCYKRLFNSQTHLFNAIPADRRDHNYCYRSEKSNMKDQRYHVQNNQRGRNQRYAAINTESYDRHHTLELRLHEGTVDCDRLIHWIDSLVSIINSKRLTASDENLDSFLDKLDNYSDENKELFRQRVTEFAS